MYNHSVASASEVLESFKEKFPQHYMDSDAISRFKSSTTPSSRFLYQERAQSIGALSLFMLSVLCI